MPPTNTRICAEAVGEGDHTATTNPCHWHRPPPHRPAAAAHKGPKARTAAASRHHGLAGRVEGLDLRWEGEGGSGGRSRVDAAAESPPLPSQPRLSRSSACGPPRSPIIERTLSRSSGGRIVAL